METVGLMCLYAITSYEDIKTRTIPVEGAIVFGVIGLLINLFTRQYSIKSLVGGLLVGGIVYIFSVLSKEKIGKGDALIIAVTGLYIGFVNTIILLWLSSILALIAGVVFVKKRKYGFDYELPFVPFLLVGYEILLMIKTIRGVL
ncbi:MAG: A24 family peptidase [Pseudobutyrivibrio sp.]|nr:A24 family peptidase [Pseudobutyrivibrio sp.]